MGAEIADGIARRLALVAAAGIIENDDIAFEGWCQALLDPGGEGSAIDRATEHEGLRSEFMYADPPASIQFGWRSWPPSGRPSRSQIS